MSSTDYAIYLDKGKFDSLFDDDLDSPFHEDMEELERLLVEELGEPKKRKKRKKPV